MNYQGPRLLLKDLKIKWDELMTLCYENKFAMYIAYNLKQYNAHKNKINTLSKK